MEKIILAFFLSSISNGWQKKTGKEMHQKAAEEAPRKRLEKEKHEREKAEKRRKAAEKAVRKWLEKENVKKKKKKK